MNKHIFKNIITLTASATLLSSLACNAPIIVNADDTSLALGPVTPKDTIYQIITDRFSDGNIDNNIPTGFNKELFDGSGKDLKLYQGGDWQGIINKIPYLKEMGITAVWISAPYENRDTEILDYQKDGRVDKWTSFHGYHVRNYYATNKHFGTLNEFKALRDALHENGIKLVIDFVTNHTSRYQNPTANFKAEDGKLYAPDKTDSGKYAIDSEGNPYDFNKDGITENLIADPNNDTKGWFHHEGDRAGDDSRWAFRNKELGSLADFSQENKEVVSFLEGATNYWVGMGIDGLRHDATLHMNPAFVKGLKDNVAEKTTISHFGEYFIGRPDPKYGDYIYFPKQTGVNNLDFEMYRSLTSTFGDFSKSMKDFGEMLQYTQKDYEYENQAVTFIDNHDVTRFGFVQREPKVYNAGLAALLTSRGTPNIYYGTEQYVQPTDASDVSGRVFMDKNSSFNTNTTAYKLIRAISDLRKDNDAIAYGETNVMYSDTDVIVFERKFYDDIVLVAINRRPDQSYTISNVHTNLQNGKYTDHLNGLLNGSEATVSNGVIANLELSGGEVNIWSYKDTSTKAPKIGDVVSTMGRAGNTVYIYGKDFENASSVKFGDVETPILENTGTKIKVQVPTEAVPGYNKITVSSLSGTSNQFDYNVLSGDQTQVVFHVKADTNVGENIYVVGNIPELGDWNPDKCSEAFLNPKHPEWYLPVSVPAGKEIKFKFIKKDASGKVIWEEGIADRSVVSSDDSAGVIDTPIYNWGQ
ncbi:cyclomaltodextrin glucanotransferase [Streptococcus varani]|uniref:Cyclomaltodextrin glucanotransferase n=2 Tax=Bacilli TaxID=91061 RepID=A0A0E4H3I6_9STRE|nr:alpha-amylase family glycosyl hydrolase [Streptococcus varani]CQR23891.1 cyclomaltodextrin glucanotransferase [Streptococcus varani]